MKTKQKTARVYNKKGPSTLRKEDLRTKAKGKSKKEEELFKKRWTLEDLPKPEFIDSDSDSAPEDVGLKESKEQALARTKEMMKSVAEAKQKLKEKRRKKDQLFASQKKQKSDQQVKKRKLNNDEEEDSEHDDGDDEDEEEQNAEDKNSDQDSGVEDDSSKQNFDFDNMEGVDFIPLNQNDTSCSGSSRFCLGVEAVYVKDEVRKAKSSAQRAADFRHQRLYGERIHRESTQKFLSRQAKRMMLRK